MERRPSILSVNFASCPGFPNQGLTSITGWCMGNAGPPDSLTDSGVVQCARLPLPHPAIWYGPTRLTLRGQKSNSPVNRMISIQSNRHCQITVADDFCRNENKYSSLVVVVVVRKTDRTNRCYSVQNHSRGELRFDDDIGRTRLIHFKTLSLPLF